MCPRRRASSSTTSSTSVSRPVSCPVLSRPDQPLLRSRSRMTIILLPSAAFSPFPIPRANHFIWALVSCRPISHTTTRHVCPFPCPLVDFSHPSQLLPGFHATSTVAINWIRLSSIYCPLVVHNLHRMFWLTKTSNHKKIPPDHYNWTANLKSRIKIHINI